MSTVDEARFKKALGQFASGVTVLTVHSDSTDHGMTASAFCSLSLDPPLILVCIKTGNRCYELIERAQTFAVNLLAADQKSLSNRFAGGFVTAEGAWCAWPEGQSHFEDVQHDRGAYTKAPLLRGALAHLECRLETIHAGGDHGIFIGRIENITLDEDTSAEPLIYFSGQYGTLASSQ